MSGVSGGGRKAGSVAPYWVGFLNEVGGSRELFYVTEAIVGGQGAGGV